MKSALCIPQQGYSQTIQNEGAENFITEKMTRLQSFEEEELTMGRAKTLFRFASISIVTFSLYN